MLFCRWADNNKLDIEIENHSWDPLFQLKVLVLSNCNLNMLTGNFPKFLMDQHELEVIDISHSKINGSFPHGCLKTILDYNG